MKDEPMTTEQLAETTNRLREKMRLLQTRYRLGEATYEEMVDAAKAFCKSFDEYHKAKHGKGKKLDWRAVIR
jgi:hypothetical protein